MSKLSIDQKTIHDLFRGKRSDFLIPDYQRPYAWEEDQLGTLWDDIFDFAIPGGNAKAFDTDDEYFLGPIVTFRNDEGRLEIIDGQQRLTTLMLLLRAFYVKFEHMKDPESKSTRERIAECIWKTDEFGAPDRDRLKIDSEVASDDDKNEFLSILKTGTVEAGQKSRYARAYTFFSKKIEDFVLTYPAYTPYLASRVLQNFILLPIEAESQRTALRIFSTLNDRGLPLSDADIFKSQFYKYFSDLGRRQEFVDRWRSVEERSEQVFARARSNPMDELFTRYMYYVRATRGKQETSTIALRDFYEQDSYALLKSEETLKDLESLLRFWERVVRQEDFSAGVLRRLCVLQQAPNSMWTQFTSVYYLHHRDENENLDDAAFERFLSLMTAFIWGYAVERPGVNALRSPIYPEMVRLVHDQPLTFENYLFDRQRIRELFLNYRFSNNRPITKSMLTWWAFQDPEQVLLDPETRIEVEHIYPRRRAEAERSLSDRKSLEALGNKAFLEKSVNIRASDYRFEDKRKYYEGFTSTNGKVHHGTVNHELRALASTQSDFTEADIQARNTRIIDGFMAFLDSHGLMQD